MGDLGKKGSFGGSSKTPHREGGVPQDSGPAKGQVNTGTKGSGTKGSKGGAR